MNQSTWSLYDLMYVRCKWNVFTNYGYDVTHSVNLFCFLSFVSKCTLLALVPFAYAPWHSQATWRDSVYSLRYCLFQLGIGLVGLLRIRELRASRIPGVS